MAAHDEASDRSSGRDGWLKDRLMKSMRRGGTWHYNSRDQRLATESFCDRCRALNIPGIFGVKDISALDGNGGHFVCLLGDITGACQLCQFFCRVGTANTHRPETRLMPDKFSFHKESLLDLGLIAFSAQDTLNIKDSTSCPDSVWLAVLPILYAINEKGYRTWERRGLSFVTNITTIQRPLGRVLQQQVDFAVVRDWIAYCSVNHDITCTPSRASVVRGFTVIDCIDRHIRSDVLIDQQGYVALSYVWGPDSRSMDHDAKTPRGKLPDNTPRVVDDAIEVTRQLGFRYLWVDRYCIRQDCAAHKAEQIENMGDIYGQASLTIIAAAGSSSSYGLPGVRGTPRDPPSHIIIDDQILATVPLDVEARIRNSSWNTRGWTYQEALLSHRRLVFTDNQVYFQCQTMSCLESLSIPLGDLHDDTGRRSLQSLTVPSVFPSMSGDQQLQESFIDNWFSEFSRRSFSFDIDALPSFRGILEKAERHGHIQSHICGMPLFLRQSTQQSSLANFLLWELSTRGRVTRRREFPSWTWLGWKLHEGEQGIRLHNPRVKMTKHAKNKTPADITASFEFGAGDVVPWEIGASELLRRAKSNHIPSHILLQCWVFDLLIPPIASMNASSGHNSGTETSFKDDFFSSQCSAKWTFGRYQYSLDDSSCIFNMSRNLGFSSESSKYTFICVVLEYCGKMSGEESFRRLKCEGLVISRQSSEHAYERLMVTTVTISSIAKQGVFPLHDQESQLGWRRADIRLA
ncbi:HET-domain-containing protein [Coniochaeta sp. PMI_546]|nr:HET-domain-containing protein [Coniochaeta sp. PMI_546]